MCLVSFIIPVYNLKKEEVSTCINSVINQTTSDYEIIIVDDGSSNGIEKFCDTIGRKLGITVIHQPNQGLAVARNTGIDASHGKWIVHVDGDDWVDKTIVDSLKKINDTTKADIIVWGFVYKNGKREQELLLKNKSIFDLDYTTIKEKALCSILDYDTSFTSIALNTSWGKAYKREFIINNNLYYDSSLRRAQDAVYNLYAFYKTSNVEYIDKALNYYRADNISLSRGYNPKTFNYLHLTALAVEKFTVEMDVSMKVKKASVVFIKRCFRMINVQLYQHKDNKLPYIERKKLFIEGINTEPFCSAFSRGYTRPGMLNKITDFLYRKRMFGSICVLNYLLDTARKAKGFIKRY